MPVNNRLKCLPPSLENTNYSAYLTIALKSLRVKGMTKQSFNSSCIRVIWWGEIESSYFRHSTTYLISLQVFEKYLRKCQLLEFTVTETKRKNDIASAFIYNPVEILEKSQLQLPVIDHSGSSIGQITLDFSIHFPMLNRKAINQNSATKFFEILNNLRSCKNGTFPQVVADYLLGVSMSENDEKTALKNLSEWSPNQSVIIEFMNEINGKITKDRPPFL